MTQGLYVQLDVDFATDDKILAAGPLAAYMYICGLALAKRTLSDGIIRTPQLAAISLGLPGRPAKHASMLVEVGLWEQVDGGWHITSWGKRNKSSADIRARSEANRQASIRANHERWHAGGKRSDSCPLCFPNRIPNRNGNGSATRLRSESTELEVETESETETETDPVIVKGKTRSVGLRS